MMKTKILYKLRLPLLFLFLFATLTGCGENLDKYCHPTPPPDPIPHICEDDCAVLLSTPSHNYTYKSTDPAPIFEWHVIAGLPERFVLEIDYLHDGTYMTGIAVGCNTYLLPEADWQTIMENAPKTDGIQKIYWRIRIDYLYCTEKEPYYSQWTYFWIESS